MLSTILDAFDQNAARSPQRLAYVHGDRTVSFAALRERSLRLAGGLSAAGVSAGAPVGVLVRQGLNFPAVVLALWRLGAVLVPFDPGAPPEDREARESIIDLPFLVADAAFQPWRATTRVLDCEELEREGEHRLPPPPQGDADAMLMFTSGTTGRPKALVHTHASLSSMLGRNIDPGRRVMSVIPGDVVLATIPLQLGLGVLDVVFVSMIAGATVLLVEPFSPRRALRAAMEGNATSIVTVPGVAKLLAAVAESVGRPALRRVSVGTALLDESVFNAFRARFGITPIRSYGMSEIGRIASTGLREETAYRPIVGWPVVDIRLLDDGGREVPSGAEGEIALRADSLCKPYCLIEGGQREPLPMAGDWFLSGDVGRFEADGALAIVGRKKAFINTPRLRVNPREVEEVLRRIEHVRDVAVVAAPGRDGYEAIHAFIVAERLIDGNRIAAFCEAHLALGKRPQIVDFIEAIPRNAAGKVEIWRLREISTRP